MSIDRILAAVEKCGDEKAIEQLKALMVLYHWVWTTTNTQQPEYGREHAWVQHRAELEQVGNELLWFLAKR